MIGLLGGGLGLLLSYLGLKGMLNIEVYASDYTVLASDIAHTYALDWSMIGSAFLIAITSTIVVGLYPIWRVCNGNPAHWLFGITGQPGIGR